MFSLCTKIPSSVKILLVKMSDLLIAALAAISVLMHGSASTM
jgi:hypothetical protein